MTISIDSTIAAISAAAQRAIEGGDTKPKSMADTLRQHRAGYVSTISASGRHSLHNGDSIATILEGASAEITLMVAQRIADDAGTDIDLMAKYCGNGGWANPRLNIGAIRMNSGNRIRGAYKRGDISIEAISELVAEIKAMASTD